MCLNKSCKRGEEEYVEEVWKLQVKPKLKHFLWKCIHDWLPTNCAIRRREVRCDETCRRCGMDRESREHLFFHYEDSMLIWKLAPIRWDRQLQVTSKHGGKRLVQLENTGMCKKELNSQYTCFGKFGR